MKVEKKETFLLIAKFMYKFLFSKRILLFLIIVLFFSLVERVLFPFSHKIYTIFVLFGAVPSIVLAMPIRLVGTTGCYPDRKKIFDVFESVGFEIYGSTEGGIHLKKKTNMFLEWEERRVIVEYNENGCKVEVLLCDWKRLESSLH